MQHQYVGSICYAEWHPGKHFHAVQVPLDSTSLYLEQADIVGSHRLTYTSFCSFFFFFFFFLVLWICFFFKGRGGVEKTM